MSIPTDRLTAIKRLPLLAKVPKSVSERLLRSAHLPHFGAGNILFREGDAPENLYLPICRSTPGAA